MIESVKMSSSDHHILVVTNGIGLSGTDPCASAVKSCSFEDIYNTRPPRQPPNPRCSHPSGGNGGLLAGHLASFPDAEFDFVRVNNASSLADHAVLHAKLKQKRYTAVVGVSKGCAQSGGEALTP